MKRVIQIHPINPKKNKFRSRNPTIQDMSVPMIFTGAGRTTGSRRPVDKQLTAVNKDATAGAQVTTTLITVTFPCTIVGLRWDLNFFQDAGTGTAIGAWAIVVLRDGVTQPTIAISDAAQFYNPEQDVMAFGMFAIDNNTETSQFIGTTKTMRKMMGGDKLVFIDLGIATNTHGLRGVVQFFCKT